ncbi:MAG: ABC transporter permease [Candidatus Acidiferrales bacterium]
METLLQDIRFGVRMLAKNPGFTLIAVLTLALGIGANTAIFSVVNAVLLRPLPYPQPQQIVTLNETILGKKWQGSVSGPNFLDWHAQNQSFSALAAYYTNGFNLTGTGEAQRISSAYITPDFFDVFGATPAMGRLFLPDEFKAGGNNVVIIGDGLWRRVFGGDPGVLGKSVTLSGQSFTVVGVLRSTFQPPSNEELWTPLQADNPLLTRSRGSHWLQVFGRIKPGVPLASARADMDTIASRLRQQYPDSNDSRGIVVVSLQERRVSGIRLALLVLQLSVGFVLLIACVNVANLLLARSEARRKEMAVRATLGAGPARVLRQLLSENILLSLVGAGLGLFLAEIGTSALLSAAPAGLVRQMGQVTIDRNVFLFTLGLSLISGLFFGLAPAIQAMRIDLNQALRDAGERSGSAGGGSRFKNSLVVLEVSLAMLLLVGAGLLIRSFGSLIRVSPGFEPHDLLTMNFYVPGLTSEAVPAQLASVRAMLAAMRNVPGVRFASTIIDPPFSGNNVNGDVTIEGRPAAKAEQEQYVEYRIVSSQFFASMGMPLLRGRDLTEQDDANRARVVIIDRTAADRYFPGQDPIGKRISMWTDGEGKDSKPVWLEIIGIAPEVHQFGLDDIPRPSAYFSMSVMNNDDLAQFMPLSPMSMVVRTSVAPATLAKPIVDAIHSVDPDMPVTGILPMDSILAQSLAQPRLASLLLGIFAGLALLLAAVGIYGVIAYNVGQRTREIGIRMALGAQNSNVLGLVLKHGMSLGLIGLGIGLAASLVLTRFLKDLLFGVGPTDPITLLVVAILLAFVAFLACYVPARRAMAVDPIVALRCE